MNRKSKQKVDNTDLLSDYITNVEQPLLLEDTIRSKPSLVQRKSSKGLKKCPICLKNIDIERFDTHKKICQQTDRRSYQQQKTASPSKSKKQSVGLLQNRKNRIGYKLYQPKSTYKFDF